MVGNLNADETVQGYEVYSSTIADVLSEPSLHTPITVGLFARWGSGKSFLIGRLRSMLYSLVSVVRSVVLCRNRPTKTQQGNGFHLVMFDCSCGL